MCVRAAPHKIICKGHPHALSLPLTPLRRWEGRPRSPPFKWGNGGMELPPHDVWLQELDLQREGVVAALIDTAAFGQVELEEDLIGTRELLIKYAGEQREGGFMAPGSCSSSVQVISCLMR